MYICINKNELIVSLSIKKAVQVVVLNEKGNVLCVSRKDNHTDFGLPGGKVETGETDVRAAIRELKEETGLDVKNMTLIYANTMYGMLGYTYFAECTGEIQTSEPHVVKWGTFKDLVDGGFGEWNMEVYKVLRKLDIKCKGIIIE